MILLEIAAQGVRGVALPGGRATLRPGYNVLAADGAGLRRLLEALLWPGPRDADSVPRAGSGAGGGGVRGGLTLVGGDGVTYRLVRDLASSCQLHRFDPERRSFSLVAGDLAAVASALQGGAGVGERGRFASLLAVASSELPSRQGGAGMRGAGPTAPPRRALTAGEAQRKLAELRTELERAKGTEKLQYQLDGLQARLFKLEEALKAGDKIREGLDASEAAMRDLEPVAKVADGLGDVDARLTAFEKASARREEALARVAVEREALDEAAGRGAAAPFWRDPVFLGGAGAGLAAVGAGAAGASSGLRYLALLDVPAFGLAAWWALRWVSALEAGERSGRRRKVLDEREHKAQEQHERDTAEVGAAMKSLGLSGLADLREAVGRLSDARAVLAEWRRRLADWEARPESRSAREEKGRVQAQIEAIEQKVTAQAGGYLRDPRSVEAEIARVEAEAAAPPPAAEPPPPVPGPASVDPIRALVQGAAAELGTSPGGAVRAVQARLGEILTAMSAQRLTGAAVDDRGNLVVQAGGKPAGAISLAPADRDLCFLALKLVFLEKALAAERRVAVVDDAFAGLPEPARRAAARFLKQAARGGQVLHGTADPVFREAADHAV